MTDMLEPIANIDFLVVDLVNGRAYMTNHNT